MFQFPRLSSRGLCVRPGDSRPSPAGFAHSETRGSKGVCPYPRTIAACRVLLRLHVPRHPPCARNILAAHLLNQMAARVSLALFQVSNDLKFWDITRMNSDRYSGVAYRDANQNMLHVSYQMLLIFTLIFAIGSDEVITSISQISENLLVTGRSASSSPSLRYAALKVRGVNPGDRVPRRVGQTVLRRTGDPAGHQV